MTARAKFSRKTKGPAYEHHYESRAGHRRMAIILRRQIQLHATEAAKRNGLVTVWFRSLVSHYATLASKAKGLMPPRYEWRLRTL
jgi:hypothetical protein